MDFIFEREIDFNGRFVIPRDIRKMLNIQSYDILAIKVEDNKIIIENTGKNEKNKRASED